MRPEAFSILSGGRVTVAITTANSTGVIDADLGQFVRIIGTTDCHFAVALPTDADLTASTGALLAAKEAETVYVPAGYEIKFFGGAAESLVSHNNLARIT